MPAAPAGSEVIGRRIAAALIDILILGALSLVIAAAAGGISSGPGSFSVSLHGGSAVLWFVLVMAYYFLLEWQFGQTPGKVLLRVRVVTRDRGHLTAWESALRTALRILDVLPLLYLVGFVCVLVTGRRAGRIGDLAAGTYVVAVA